MARRRSPGAETLLEVSCGTGHFAAGLERRRQRVIGLDRSPAMLAELRRRHAQMPVVLGDWHTLPFRDGAVDVTLFVTTLEFLERPAVALREAVRVSRRGLAILALIDGAAAVSPDVEDRAAAAPSVPTRTT